MRPVYLLYLGIPGNGARNCLMLARKILLSLLVGYPKWKVRCRVAAEFPLAKMLRLSIEPVGLQEIQEGGKVNNGVVHNSGCLLHLDLHTHQITFLPTS